MNKIEEGIAANDAAIADVKNNYMPKSGGYMAGPLTVGSNISIDDSGSSICAPAVYAGPTSSHATFISSDRITFPDNRGEITSVSDSKGTSSTIVPSQKCLNDNYVAKSDLPSNLLKYQVINSTSDIGTDANTAYLILE